MPVTMVPDPNERHQRSQPSGEGQEPAVSDAELLALLARCLGEFPCLGALVSSAGSPGRGGHTVSDMPQPRDTRYPMGEEGGRGYIRGKKC